MTRVQVPDLLTPGEVAELLRVDVKTVARYAQTGLLQAIRTPGGHRRYSVSEINALRGAIASHETALSASQVTAICDALNIGPDPKGAKERIQQVLAGLGPGAVIRVTG